MESLVYLDLGRKTASENLTGSRFVWPEVAFGEELTIGVRLAQRFDGVLTEVSRTVDSLRASIGRIDTPPESGTYKLKIGSAGGDGTPGTDLTADIEHDANAGDIAAALNATTIVGTTYGTASAKMSDGSLIVTFDGETSEVPLEAKDNTLQPVSFARIRAYEFNSEWKHEIRLHQSPIASTSVFTREQPPAPSIALVQAGGSNGDTVWNELQALTIPANFRGTYQIRSGDYARTSLLSTSDGAEEIATALAELADDGEEFIVTNPEANVAHIEFAGDMGGAAQSLLTVDVFNAPEGDITFTLDLDTADLAALLRDAESVELPIEVEAEIQDEDTPSTTYTRKLYSGEITINRPLNFDGISTAASVDWLNPPSNDRYEGWDLSQVSNGQLHYSETIGDGAADTFIVAHNLGVDNVAVFVRENSAGGDLLVHGDDFTLDIDSDSSLDITFAVTPTSGQYVATVLGLEATSYFDPHGHPITDITGLQTYLDNFGTRISTLESLAGASALTSDDTEDGGRVAEWTLPELFEIYPSRAAAPDVESINEIKAEDLPRARGLLPAVHNSTVEPLPANLPSAAQRYRDRVYRNEQGATVNLPGGQGHRGAKLKAGEFAACDGRAWYQVAPYSRRSEDIIYTATIDQQETQTITCVEDDTGSLDGLYFIIRDDGDNSTRAYWIDVDNDGTTEPAHGADGSTEITTITQDMTATQVATQVALAIDAIGYHTATSSDAVVTLVADDDYDYYPADAGTSGFGVATTVEGSDFGYVSPSHGLSNGEVVRLKSPGSLPAPLFIDTDYYVINAATDTFELSASSGGAAIALTAPGVGVQKMSRGGVVVAAANPGAESTYTDCVADVSGSLDGTYFILYYGDSVETEVSRAFWIDVDDSGTAEPAHGADESTEITTITEGMTDSQVAAEVKLAVDAEADLSASVSSARVTTSTVAMGSYTAPDGGTSGFTCSKAAIGATEFTWTSTAHGFEVGDVVQVSAMGAGSVPSGFSASTDYYIQSETDDTFRLSATSGGDPVAFSDDGTGTIVLAKSPETSYYPTAFERELFKIHINEKQLRLRKTFDLSFAIELGVLESNTSAQWVMLIERGEYAQASGPGNVGQNLREIAWDDTPWLEQPIILMPTVTSHRFGLQVTREMVSSVDTITPKARLYGALEGGLDAPSSANFAVRARLVRFDTEDCEFDPDGFVALRGLNLTGTLENNSATEDGTAVIY